MMLQAVTTSPTHGNGRASANGPRVKVRMNWTPEEDDLVRTHFQDRRKLEAMLPHRTASAIKTRVRELQLTLHTRYIAITAKDSALIRKLAKTCRTYEEVAATIGLSTGTVYSHMQRYGIIIAKSAPKMTGFPLVDAVRQRAFQLKLSLSDLDRSLGYRMKHFSKCNGAHKISVGQINNAAKALGGRLVILWDDEQEDD